MCGACTILVDDRPARACLSLAVNSEGTDIRTLEGLNDQPDMRLLQQAFAKAGAFQCGFCTPGMLVSAQALLRGNPAPDAQDVRKALSGNLCRCTGYTRIVSAVLDAAAMIRKEPVAP